MFAAGVEWQITRRETRAANGGAQIGERSRIGCRNLLIVVVLVAVVLVGVSINLIWVLDGVACCGPPSCVKFYLPAGSRTANASESNRSIERMGAKRTERGQEVETN